MNGDEEPATVFYIGHHESSQSGPVPDETISRAEALGYDFVTTPITTKAFHDNFTQRVHDSLDSLLPPLTPTDTVLEPTQSNSSRIAFASPWIDLGSASQKIAHISRQVLNLEIAYAAFCGVNNVVVHGPTEGSDVVQYARAIQEALALGPYLQIHVLIAMDGDLEMQPDGVHLAEFAESDLEDMDACPRDNWETWDTIRSLCSYSNKLSIALEIPRQLPTLQAQHQWYSEPVRLLAFPRTSFVRNAKGYPVLSKSHQSYISLFARLRFPPWLLLCDTGAIPEAQAEQDNTASQDPTPGEAAAHVREKPIEPVHHLKYLRHLQQNQPSRPPIERFGQGYQDYLQSPLQPLTDNLESVTYEVFEKDPVKYEWYERAIAAALTDLHDIVGKRPIVLVVVGAGRGPLVTRALQASNNTGVKIDCYAVEKNPNAYVLLQRRNAKDELWDQQVQVVKSDMRHWSGPMDAQGSSRKVDIFISELLGSFADNELSPECLDGVQRHLQPEHGISIPQSYSAHLTPIATPRLYSDLLGRGGSDKWDIPYVVMLHQFDYLCTFPSADEMHTPDVKEAWSFSHPLPAEQLQQSALRSGGGTGAGGWVGGDGSNEHNARSCKLTFTSEHYGVCHGLAGYFETVLYAGKSRTVELSTNPVTIDKKSKDMISWFPIFFPIKTPLFVPVGAELVVYMWRQTDDRKVWYEWLIEVWQRDDQKRKRKIGMSEIGSSRKNGCLM